MVEKLQNKFAEVFGTEGEAHVYFAPGRVNMIGEPPSEIRTYYL